ncbi:CrcB protein [Scopulibacillus daqui]|uniref:Fluoride-specific ion channel FluC n=1 Tax=Scopulibacillus daqui TaxID=1469162 RepID=A0ABS2Q0C1_9BACL|nr:fluoride efflux transporter CrcB [Scopulibacillus daqui]MBM7645576.1 CrcB protein [Scopulibacillus daqui]
MFINVLLVGIGGFFGAISRYWISGKFNKKGDLKFPYGTLIVNLVGAFLLGLITASSLSASWQVLLGTGFMGAFTTFSTFKLENIQMHLKRQRNVLIAYLAASYIGGIILAFLGMMISVNY